MKKKDNSKDITLITKNYLCFSCGACSAACPKDCIDFNITGSGRKIPIIDYDKCIYCEICYKVCPGIDEKYEINKRDDLLYGNVINCYLGRSSNEEIYKNSQSGGMVTEVLIYLLDKKLIKYALVVGMDYSRFPNPTYKLVSKKEDLLKYQKSIYLPINILDALKIKNIKDIDGEIAIVGVGCQIQGLETLKKFAPKLFYKIKYKLGLICDGTLSYLSNEFFKINDEYRIIYKDKFNKDYINANVVLLGKNKTKVIDRYLRFLLKDYTTPTRCYLCIDKMNIYADFVFGDPWGIEGYDKKFGDSIVITRNEEADNIIQEIIKEKRAFLRKIPYEDILRGQKVEEKKEKVLKALAVYRKLGLEIPKYYRDWNIPKEIDKRIERKILRQIKLESSSLEKYKVKVVVYMKYYLFLLKKIIKKILMRG